MNESRVKSLRVLVLGAPDCGTEFSEWMAAHASVDRVDDFAAALRAMREASYDLVISNTGELASHEGSGAAGHATALLDAVNQGICIVDNKGDLEWANAKLLSLPDEIRDRIRQCCLDTFASAERESKDSDAPARGRRFSFTTDRDEHFEVSVTPVTDLHHRVTQVAAITWETTSARRLRDKIDAIDRAGCELLSFDSQQIARLDVEERLSLLEQKILRSTRDLLHFDTFGIHVIDKGTNKLNLVLASGMPARVHDIDLHATPEGNGIAGYVASRGRSYICADAKNDPRYLPGILDAESSLTVPLILRDQIVGVANFESGKLAAFNEDDRQFAEIFARYVALALHLLELLVTERYSTTGRLGNDVMAEITAPVNDILTDVESLVEDYIGHDDLRHRLRQVSDNAVKIRDTIKAMTSTDSGLVGVHTSKLKRRDPALEGKRVLIADDEDIIRDTVRDVLTGYGCVVSTAIDGVEAIELLERQPFDLVLSDIKMPRKSGYDVFSAAKDANTNTPVILTTGFGYDPNHSIIRARREGLAAVLFKPFKVDQLLHEIRTALAAANDAG